MGASSAYSMKAMGPQLAKAGAAAGAAYLGKKISGPSKEQKAGLAGAQGSVNDLSGASQPLLQQGSALARQGGENVAAAGNYYRGILGNRRQAREAVSPEINTIMDFYRGAEGKAKRTLRGGARDMAVAELGRQRVGQTAAVIPGARANAAEGLGNLGGTALSGGSALTGQGAGLAAQGAQASNSLYNMASHQQEQQRQGGASMGNFIYDILGSSFGSKKPPAALPAGGGGQDLSQYIH